MKFEGLKIVIVSNEKWSDIWYSKHNWANELSNKNKVFFVNPAKWNILKFFLKPKCRKVQENLYVVDYYNLLPLTSLFVVFCKINDFLVFYKLRNLLRVRKKSDSKKILFWSFDPHRLLSPSLLGDCSKSTFFYADQYTCKGLDVLLKNVDFVLSVSNVFLKNIPTGKPMLTLSHGISADEFVVEEHLKRNFKESIPKEDYCIYVGAIDKRLDYEVLEYVVQQNPKLHFLFVGPFKHGISIDNCRIFQKELFPNVSWHPPVKFKELKFFIESATIAIAPMKFDFAGNMINHHKLFQYFAMGKPVVSPLFSDYSDKRHLIYSYQTKEECAQHIETLLNTKSDVEGKEKRIIFAKEHTYDKLLNRIEKFLAQNSHLFHDCQ